MRDLIRPLTAEFVGTFALVFVGCAAIVSHVYSNGAIGITGIALAHGIVLSVMVTATMRISGGHLNPAVTLALWMAGRISGSRAVWYAVTQLAAGVAAAFLVKTLFPLAAGAAAGWGAPRLTGDLGITAGILIEAVMTFFLVSAVFGTVVAKDAPAVGGFGIGLVLVFAILAAGPFTGAALNTARAFGPTLVSGEWHAHIVWWLGPTLGGAAAGLLWAKVLLVGRE